MFAISSLANSINLFNHSNKPLIDNHVEILTRNLRPGDNIKVLHTPFVLPLGTSDEIGGYARSLGFSFGPKWIAVNIDRLSRETPSMQKFILARQIALFDKSSRCLHLPLAAVAVVIAAIASSILFPSSILAAVTIPAIVGLASAAKIATRERENEHYADLQAFRNCDYQAKEHVMICLEEKIEEEQAYKPQSFIKNIFSGYPSAQERHYRLFSDSQNTNDFRQCVINRLNAKDLAREIEMEELG